MLCNELVAVAEVGREVPADAVGARHQQINEVVDDDRDLGTHDRLLLQLNRPIGSCSHGLITRQRRRPISPRRDEPVRGPPGD